MSLRVIHVYKDYFPVLGGIENHVRVLAEAQAAAGLDVTVLVCHPEGRAGRERLAGVEIIRAKRLATALSMPISVEQPRILARWRGDLIHVHSPYPLGEVGALAGRHQARLVITHHADVIRQRTALRCYAPLLRRVLRSADRIVATSPRYITSSPWLEPVADRCCVIPLGVDEQRFSPASGTAPAPWEFLFVGKLRHYKGLDVLLRALSGIPDAKLRVVGEGPMGSAWQALAHDLGLSDRVRFEGRIADSELAAAYREARIFVLPSTSRAEAFGTVLLEAMASGLPCVTTEVGTGTSWVVRHGETGLVAAADDVDALRGALTSMLADDATAATMGRAARRRIEEGFTERTMTARVLRLYEALSRGAGQSQPGGRTPL